MLLPFHFSCSHAFGELFFHLSAVHALLLNNGCVVPVISKRKAGSLGSFCGLSWHWLLVKVQHLSRATLVTCLDLHSLRLSNACTPLHVAACVIALALFFAALHEHVTCLTHHSDGLNCKSIDLHFLLDTRSCSLSLYLDTVGQRRGRLHGSFLHVGMLRLYAHRIGLDCRAGIRLGIHRGKCFQWLRLCLRLDLTRDDDRFHGSKRRQKHALSVLEITSGGTFGCIFTFLFFFLKLLGHVGIDLSTAAHVVLARFNVLFLCAVITHGRGAI